MASTKTIKNQPHFNDVPEKPAIVGGGFKAIRSVLRYAIKIGPWALYKTVRSKNACKACAFGTGGQNGGIYNEARKGIEICNKNIQAHLSDIRKGIPQAVFLEKSIEDLSQLSGKEIEGLGRLSFPLYKKPNDTHYSPITYEDATRIITERLKESEPDQSFFYASGRSSNEAAFLLQLLARLYGTNNVNNCSYYCHQASGVALTNAIGTGTATIEYQDLDKADTIFVFGANPASNHPRFLKTLMQCRRRGGNVIVVNPAVEPGMVRFASPSDFRSMLKGGEEIASHYVQPHLGGDLAFMHGIIKCLVLNKQYDETYIANYTEGFSDLEKEIRLTSWDAIVEASGVSKAEIESIADVYAQSQHTVMSWSMGLTHHRHGVKTIETLAGLALMRGMIGKPGAGLLPLRGHSNIQGTGSMGFTPQLKAAVEEKIEKEIGESLPKKAGLDTMACMEASAGGRMRAAVMLGGNLLASNPDTRYATQALNAIPFKCFINSTLNISHVNGVSEEVLVLPIRARDEEQQATTQESMFNYVRLSDGGAHRFPQLISEVELICNIGEALIDKQRVDFSIFRDHTRIRDFLGKVIPGFHAIRSIDQNKKEFHIDGRVHHKPVFATTNGKARFQYYGFESRKSRVDDKSFMLTSVRSEGQFNSIIYHEQDTYRGQNERWVVMMHVDDIRALGLQPNTFADIKSHTGEMKKVRVRAFSVKRGNAMVYYPEANCLIPRDLDRQSKTPGFKSVPVQICAAIEN